MICLHPAPSGQYVLSTVSTLFGQQKYEYLTPSRQTRIVFSHKV